MAKAEQANRTARDRIRAERGLEASSDVERVAADLVDELIRLDRIRTRLLKEASAASEKHGLGAIVDAAATEEHGTYLRDGLQAERGL